MVNGNQYPLGNYPMPPDISEEEEEKKGRIAKLISILLLLLLLAALFYLGYITVKRLFFPQTTAVLTADAGPDKQVWKKQSFVLQGEVKGAGTKDVLIYKWSCQQGALSSDSVLKPTYTAPDIPEDIIDTCILAVNIKNKKGKGAEASDEIKIAIKNSSIPVTLSANVKEVVISKAVDLLAFVAGVPEERTNYNFWCDCSYDSTNLSVARERCGKENLRIEKGDPFEYNVKGICKYADTGNYTPKVIVEKGTELGEARTNVSAVKKPNNPPTINAGPDKTVVKGKQTVLQGSASDPEKDPLTYDWSCEGEGKLSNAKILKPTYTAPQVDQDKIFVCTLTVSDGTNTVSDTMRVSVKASEPPPSPNHPPVANAGSDMEMWENTSANLNGLASYDLDGDRLSFNWSCTGGRIENPIAAKTIFTAPEVPADINIICTLDVSDGKDTSSSQVNIKVKDIASHKNSPPVANAGSDRQYVPGSNVILDGSQSFDPDGDVLNYLWSCLKGAEIVQISGAYTSRATFTAPEVSQDTDIVCTLTVTDPQNANSSDSVTIKIIKGGTTAGNYAPYAEAGDNLTVLEGQRVTLDGSGSKDYDAGDKIASYKWVCDGGTISGDTTAYPIFTAPLIDADQQSITCTLTVRDTKGESASDWLTITVKNVVALNRAPIAKIVKDYYEGFNYKYINSGSTVVIDGSQSSDPDGDPLTYLWTCDDGCFRGTNFCSLTDYNKTSKVSWQSPWWYPCEPNYKMMGCTLTVSDGKLSSTDNINFNVACYINETPVYDCGNGVCESGETAISCPSDCGQTPTSSLPPTPSGCDYDGVCESGELTSCSDCDFSYKCGNGMCEPQFGETTSTCPSDCRSETTPPSPTGLCGNGVCDLLSGENATTCPIDCYVMGPICGNGVCELGETAASCPSDCSTQIYGYSCSNNCSTMIVGGTYTSQSACVSACGGASCDNDGVCESGELTSCQDCMAPTYGYSCSNSCSTTILGGTYTTQALCLSACGTGTNHPPVANAGSDKTVSENSSISLQASVSDVDGDPLTYTWACNLGWVFPSSGSVPSGTATPQSISASYNSPEVTANTTDTCILTVSDNRGGSGEDSVVISITDTGGGNQAPIANAGGPYTVNEGSWIYLNGTGSSDPDGNLPLSYYWSECTGGTLSNPNSAQAVYTAPQVTQDNTVYTCKLRVTDSLGAASTMVTATITVKNVNHPPVAYAGGGYGVNENTPTTLNKATATDPDGDTPLTYSWSCTAGTLSNNTVLQPIYTHPSVTAPTSASCTLTVTDPSGLSNSSTAMIQINNVSVTLITSVYPSSISTYYPGCGTFTQSYNVMTGYTNNPTINVSLKRCISYPAECTTFYTTTANGNGTQGSFSDTGPCCYTYGSNMFTYVLSATVFGETFQQTANYVYLNCQFQ